MVFSALSSCPNLILAIRTLIPSSSSIYQFYKCFYCYYNSSGFIFFDMITRSIFRALHRYGQNMYQKIRLTRLPNEQVVIMVKENATVQELYQQIEYNFPKEGRQFIATSTFNHNLQQMQITDQMRNEGQNIKEAHFLPILLSNDLFVYEVSNNQAHLLYGIQTLELGLTNNRNIPEVIGDGIIHLVNEWENAQTVQQALSMPHMAKRQVLLEEKHELNQSIAKTVNSLQIMNKIQLANPLNNFVNKMSILMGANWVFLYVITFGYYGWDVGEPISYLSAVGVDLLAMLGWFDLEKRLTEEFEVNEGKYTGFLNLTAQKRNQKWLHCYLRRKII